MEKLIKHTVLILTWLIVPMTMFSLNAQDGEALFKAKCAACHIMGKDGTGPNLQNVKAKWEGEEEFLIEWVLNSPKVIAEGKSSRAQEVKDYNPTVMPIQDVTAEEAQAIIDYVDVWTPPAPKVEDAPPGGEEVVVTLPDYKKNLTLFYVMLAVIGFLLIAILVVSRTTAGLIKSDAFRDGIIALKEKNGGSNALKTVILLIIGMGLSTNASALSFEVPQMAKETNLWVYVENSDIYVLLIIALLLLGFLMQQVNMFYKVLRIMKPISKEEKKAQEEAKTDFTRILTGAVPIEEEHKIDLGHDYDGIRELDNPMPPWWLAGFFISIVFAVIYMFHYHVFGTGDLQEVEYEKSMAKAKIEVQAYREKMAMNVDETNATLMTDENDLAKGKELFVNNCAVCHKENGSGAAGPNLTDDYWVYGGDIKDVYKVIRLGAPNGMPEHQSKFNPIQIQQVASYVLHFDYVSPENGGLEPQGDLHQQTEPDPGENEEGIDQ